MSTSTRTESPEPGFSWQGKLRLGSSLDEVLQALGPLSETVVGKSLDFSPSTLYEGIDGDKGHCYYSRSDQHIRLFFWSCRVCALYIALLDETSLDYKQ